MMAISKNKYTKDPRSQENINEYSSTGESDFSIESSHPLDENEILSERHYNDPTKEDRPLKKFSGDFTGVGPKNFTKSDKAIEDDVCETLWRNGNVNARDIEVKVDNGIVTLKGYVDSRHQKKQAEAVIENLFGVLDVFNELTIKGEIKKNHPHGLIDNITGLN
jgi:hypothetical protein